MTNELTAANNIGATKDAATVEADAAGYTSDDGIEFTINKGTAEVAEKLSFSLHVGSDADMTNKITVDIETMNSSYLGIKGLNVNDDSGIAATYAVDAISDAISKVSSQRYNEKIIREESRNRYKVYETIYDIDDDIAQEIGNSKNLIFYGLRGKTLINSNSKMADEVKKNKDKIKCKILVSNPYNKYIGERLKKLPEFENQSDIEKHWKCIYENIKQLPTYFSDFKDKGIRYHELPLVYRFIMTDDSIYFGYYTNEHSSKSLMYR